MASYDVAHLREQGVDLIIIPLDHSFGYKTEEEQHQILGALQLCATSAGLVGRLVPVWDGGGGRMAFIAPPNWHPFLRSISLGFVGTNINRQLTCG